MSEAVRGGISVRGGVLMERLLSSNKPGTFIIF